MKDEPIGFPGLVSGWGPSPHRFVPMTAVNCVSVSPEISMLLRSVNLLRITPRMVELTTPGGASATVELAESVWTEAWRGGEGVIGPIRRAAEQLGVAGSSVEVQCSGPESVAEVFSIPSVGPAAEAAAMLAIKESVRFDIAEHPASCERVWVDTGATPRTHVLAAAALDEEVEVVRGWARAAGLRPATVTVDRIGVIRSTLEDLRAADDGDEGFTIVVRLEDQCSVIAGAVGGVLRFVRVINIGTDMLVDAAFRALRGASAEARWSAARDELFASGVTLSRQGEGAFDRSVIAAMQPVIQRYLVELKQTLRFSVGQGSSSPVGLHVRGRGGRIPGLAKTLCGAMEMDLASLADGAARRRERAIHLRTASQRAGRSMLVARASILAGGLLAAGWIAMGAGSAADGLENVRAELHAMSPRIDRAERTHAATVQARMLENRVWDAEKSLVEAAGRRASIGSLLADLSHLASERVRLTGVMVSGEPGGVIARIEGVALMEGAVGANAIRAYADTIENLPTVEGVTFGTMRSVSVDGSDARSFALSVRLRELPVADLLDRALGKEPA